MAEDKKSFVLYSDLLTVVKKLVLQDRINKTNYGGELFLIILEYVNDLNPVPIDFIVELAFEPIKLQLKRDLVKWSEFREKQALNGSKGGRPKKDLDNLDNNKNPKNPSLLEESQKSLNVTVSVNDSVNVNDNVTVTDIITPKVVFNFKNSLIDYGFEENLVDDWLKIRKSKKATNTETAFKKFISEIEKTNKDKNEILEIIITKSWKGFENAWLNNNEYGKINKRIDSGNNTSFGKF